MRTGGCLAVLLLMSCGSDGPSGPALEPRPDVIFFLTDGEIPRSEETLAAVTLLNSRGRRVVINTIAFGDPASQELLREIARRSGGIYRFVSSDDL